MVEEVLEQVVDAEKKPLKQALTFDELMEERRRKAHARFAVRGEVQRRAVHADYYRKARTILFDQPIEVRLRVRTAWKAWDGVKTPSFFLAFVKREVGQDVQERAGRAQAALDSARRQQDESRAMAMSAAFLSDND